MVLKFRHSEKVNHKVFEMWCWGRMEITWTDVPKSPELLHRVKEIGNILRTRQRRKANWNCLLKHVIEGKIKETRRGGRRLKELLLKESEDTANRRSKHQLALSG